MRRNWPIQSRKKSSFGAIEEEHDIAEVEVVSKRGNEGKEKTFSLDEAEKPSDYDRKNILRSLYGKRNQTMAKLDRYTAKMIATWIRKNLNGISDPRRIGKPLKGELSHYWRYRVGDYPIIAEIVDYELIIQIVKMAIGGTSMNKKRISQSKLVFFFR